MAKKKAVKKTARKKASRKKRATIGPGLTESASAVDAYLEAGTRATKASRRGLAPAGTKPRKPPKEFLRVPKVRATFHLSESLVDALRDAVVALAGPPARLTLAGLAEDALRKELEALKKKYNGGRPFPPRSGDLKGGRPIGS